MMTTYCTADDADKTTEVDAYNCDAVTENTDTAAVAVSVSAEYCSDTAPFTGSAASFCDHAVSAVNRVWMSSPLPCALTPRPERETASEKKAAVAPVPYTAEPPERTAPDEKFMKPPHTRSNRAPVKSYGAVSPMATCASVTSPPAATRPPKSAPSGADSEPWTKTLKGAITGSTYTGHAVAVRQLVPM